MGSLSHEKTIRIVALTEAGKQLAETLYRKLLATHALCGLWYKPQPFADKVREAFCRGDALIMICATGIVVRTLAPVINCKKEDPPVIVMDEQGQFVIPLLSGHEGGANDWAAEIASLLNAQLVMTTAQPYLKPFYAVGMGCERNCPEEELQALLESCLLKSGICLQQVAAIGSIDIKADEPGLVTLASQLNKPYRTFDKGTLSEVEALLSTRSNYVFKTAGVYGVAESAALVAAQRLTSNSVELVLTKQKSGKATCAIARSYPKVEQRYSHNE